MEVPFFVPTTLGDLAGIASLPASGRLRSPAVVLLPGGRNPRTRGRADLDAARRVATSGHPVLRLDYPGNGLSPRADFDLDERAESLLEASVWWKRLCEVDGLVLGGFCRGARFSLQLAALSSEITAVVAIGLPVAGRTMSATKVEIGLAAIDSVGKRLAPALARSTSRKSFVGWKDATIADLSIAGARADIVLLYGADDHFYTDFLELLESGGLPDEVTGRLDVRIRPGCQVYGNSKIEDLRWIADTVFDAIAGMGSTQEVSRG